MTTPAAPPVRLLGPVAHLVAVPTLMDSERGVVLRAHDEADLPRVVEQGRDAQTLAWTNVPSPAGGYGPGDARDFLAASREGWQDDRIRTWAVSGPDPVGPPRYDGTITLALLGERRGDLSYVLHPDARGRGTMSAAARLVVAFGFEVERLDVVHWEAYAGHLDSWRVAEAAGFRWEGTRRRGTAHRGGLRDVWTASVTADDRHTPVERGWTPPTLAGIGAGGGGVGAQVMARPFRADDLDRVVQACRDPDLRHWLAGLPEPYDAADARAHLADGAEQALRRQGLTWCLADPENDRCLGSLTLSVVDTHASRAEVGYWVHPDARARGVATAGLRLVSAWAEESGLVGSILIRCAEGNRASQRVAESAGYVRCGFQPAAELLGDGSRVGLVSFSRP